MRGCVTTSNEVVAGECLDTSYDLDRSRARLELLGLSPTYRGSGLSMEGDRLLSLAVDVAAKRSLQGVLQTIVRGLASHPGVALVRIWLQWPGDICDACFLRAECHDRTRCFHLVASGGTPVSSPDQDWSFLQGYFRRIPMNAFKVGQVGGAAFKSLR